MIPVITQNEPDKIQLMEWGLIPSWARDYEHAKQMKKGTYNARAESLSEKASFKLPVENNRCWVVSVGFFEWQHIAQDKIPWHIQLKDKGLFAFAGIYDTLINPVSEEKKNTFSIITTTANPLMERIHNTKKRMPVILSPEIEKQWLSQNDVNESKLALLSPIDESLLYAYTIKKGISSAIAKPDDPSILEHHPYHINQSLF